MKIEIISGPADGVDTQLVCEQSQIDTVLEVFDDASEKLNDKQKGVVNEFINHISDIGIDSLVFGRGNTACTWLSVDNDGGGDGKRIWHISLFDKDHAEFEILHEMSHVVLGHMACIAVLNDVSDIGSTHMNYINSMCDAHANHFLSNFMEVPSYAVMETRPPDVSILPRHWSRVINRAADEGLFNADLNNSVMAWLTSSAGGLLAEILSYEGEDLSELTQLLVTSAGRAN